MSLRNILVSRFAIPQKLTIDLTDVEDRVCQLLDDYVNETQQDTTCRIAGGWVRDKLLGSQSNDIDIALSNTMGLAFAQGLAAYANNKGVETGTISKIAQNPEQSKHLETATFKVFGLDIDLVNLRSEEYASGSRIPTDVSFGTPLQDALRRDITINALFYNVHSRTVEDFTEKGLRDLQSGIIRTPLPPRETFLDDPLRVLRCVRFASRFGFNIVPEIGEAAKDPEIRRAIVSKVANERIGEELAKMIKGRDPLRSVELIYDLSLYDPIFFTLPEQISSTLSESPASPSTGLAAASLLRYLLEGQENKIDSSLPKLSSLYHEAVKTDSTCPSRLYLAAALTPYRRITYRDKKNKELPLVALIIRESLKLGTQNHFMDGVPQLFAACDIIIPAVAQSDKLHPSSDRVRIGSLIRQKSIHNSATGSHWTSSFLFSLVQELTNHYHVEDDVLDTVQASKVIKKYNDFAEKVESLGLRQVNDMRSLLDGRQVVAALEAKAHGAWVGQVLGQVIEWQLEHPEGTQEECTQWLREQQQAGYVDVDNTDSGPANKRPRTKK